MKRQREPETGFTLTELLVVMAVIGILASLAAPAYQRVVQSGRATGCASNLRQISVGLSAYLADNNNVMPILLIARPSTSVDGAVIDTTLAKYIANPGVFACPADVNGFAQKTGTSYFWNVALNGQSAAHLILFPQVQGSQNTQSPSQIPVLGDKEGFHPYLENKVNVLYADGHVSKDLSFATGN